MTTYQDPLPQSRRAVREQHERESAQAAVVPTTGPTPTPVAPEAPPEPLTYTTQGRIPVPNYDGPALRARRTPEPAGELPAEGDAEGSFRPRDFSPEGRRSAPPTWAPQYGGAPAAEPAAAGEAGESGESADDIEAREHTLTRRELRALRDAHGITAQTTGETVYPTPAPDAAAAAAPAPAPEAPAPVAPTAAAPDTASPTPAVDPGTPLVAPSNRLDSALAEFDHLANRSGEAAPRGRRAAEAPADAPQPPVAVPEAAVSPAPAEPVAEVPAQPVPLVEPPVATAPPVTPAAPVVVPDAAPAPESYTPAPDPQPIPAMPESVQPAPAEATPVAPAPVAEPVAQAPQPAPPVAGAQPPVAEVVVAEIVPPVEPEQAAPSEPIVEATVVEATIIEAEPAASAEPSTSTPPTGHWTTQAQLDDETQFGDASLSRNIGATSGAITTSALVLPSIPNHDFGPLPTGDVMVTGSISLPESLAATGAHPSQLDEHALDHLLDPGDHQVASTDSQPVRAIKAVSTHTNSGGVIQNVKPKGTKGLTALIIAATSMAVVVGALFIVLVVTGQL